MNGISRLRKKANLTQRELAEKLNVRQSTVAMWEAGTNMPKASRLPEV